MLPIITAIPPPRISAGGWPLSRPASIRTPAPSPIASKITSTLTKKNTPSQGSRGLAQPEGKPPLYGLSRRFTSANRTWWVQVASTEEEMRVDTVVEEFVDHIAWIWLPF